MYTQPSGPSVGLATRSCSLLLLVPNPVSTTRRTSALPSPVVSLRNQISGAHVRKIPPFHGITPLGNVNPSANVVRFSKSPSPSASTNNATRPNVGTVFPLPGRNGYPRPSTTNIRPASSKHIATGSFTCGSLAANSTRTPFSV